MAPNRLHRLLPALALLVAACAAPVTASPSASPAASPAASTPTAATGSGAPSGSPGAASPVATPAPTASPTARSTPRPTLPPATRPPATRPPATRPPATSAPSAVAAKIVDFGFSPTTLTVTVGTTVTWTNTGQVDHTVTANGGAFASGTLSPGASFSFTFRTAGTFAYHCTIHPFMTGTVIVKG